MKELFGLRVYETFAVSEYTNVFRKAQLYACFEDFGCHAYINSDVSTVNFCPLTLFYAVMGHFCSPSHWFRDKFLQQNYFLFQIDLT